jgi:hypothetical protein
MKVPDGNKPIRVGDTSFVYKGVYHPIFWLGKDPYRPRVEMLVIKDARYVYLRLKDDIEKTPPDKRTHKYAIPGGSLDADSTKLEQAIAETNEEALVQVTLVYNSGIQYYELYEPGFLLKGGDMPIEYVGSVSDIFVGVYDGPYDKSKVEEKDLDDDMANNGKFYDIADIARYLRKEHIQALINSQFVAEDKKAALRLYRTDVINESTEFNSPILVPGDMLYHGSTYEIETFHPMSLDLGNVFQTPGWSTFCFADYEFAKLFGAARAFTKMIKDSDDGDLPESHNEIEFIVGHLVMYQDTFEYLKSKDLLDIKVKFYVYTIDPTNLDIGIGNDPALREYTFREDNVTPVKTDVFQLSLMDLRELIEVLPNDTEIVHPHTNEYSTLLNHKYDDEQKVVSFLQKAIDDGELKPGDDIEKYMQTHDINFENGDDISIPEISVGVEETIFEGISVPSSILEQKYSTETYGLPERKAYPMPDEKHVRSAIRFFNYASAEEEKELAENINKKIRKFKIKDISVGDKNRFKKYYKPLVESFSLGTFYDASSQCVDKLNSLDNPLEKYKVYDTMKGLTRMLVDYLLHGDKEEINNLDTEKRQEIITGCYSALAEIAMNQTECLHLMEAKEVRTLYLKSVMEADDDDTKNDDDAPEGATDYTAMADDQGAEDDNDNTDDDAANTNDDDTNDDNGDSGDDTAEDDSDTSDNSENDKRYNNKEIKNYFLLNSFLSMHETVVDVLDTVNGVVLPTPDANGIMAKVVKNLQSVKAFIEKFIQFQFSENDYAFNLYYYNILMDALRMNLKLFETAVQVSGGVRNRNNEKEE